MSRWFWTKAVVGGVGLVLAIAGMALQFRPLVWGAVGLLAAAFLLRLIERRTADSRSQ